MLLSLIQLLNAVRSTAHGPWLYDDCGTWGATWTGCCCCCTCLSELSPLMAPATAPTARWAIALPVPNAIPCITVAARPDISPPLWAGWANGAWAGGGIGAGAGGLAAGGGGVRAGGGADLTGAGADLAGVERLDDERELALKKE